MQMLLQDYLAQHWLMLAGLPPTQERTLASILMEMFDSLWPVGAAGATSAYLKVVEGLDQHLRPIVFVGFFLVFLSVPLFAMERRSPGLNAASARVPKAHLKFRSLASASMIGGLLLLLMAFIPWMAHRVH